MRGHDNIHGANGNDRVEGGQGLDTLYGDSGNDTIVGGEAGDTLYGNNGNDQLYGQSGGDTFVFSGALGNDRVRDFVNDVDTLKFDDAIWGGGKSVAQVVAQYAKVVGSDTVFDFGGGNKVTVSGITDTSVFLNDIIIF